ncbi:hypothetical protein FCV25MIE_12235 [Fagus crenata]
MEGVSATMYKGLRGYWKKRGYERLTGSGRKRTKMARVELGSTRRRRFWKIKITPKLRRFKGTSPKNFFVWLRDAYVKMMMGFANSRVVTSTGYGETLCNEIGGFTRGPIKEYDEKVIVQIYKSLMMAQGQLVPRDAANLGSLR